MIYIKAALTVLIPNEFLIIQPIYFNKNIKVYWLNNSKEKYNL